MVTTWSPRPRPEWVEALNATGEHVGSADAVVALEVDELLDRARTLTGLDDFGGDAFLEPFRLLVDSVGRDGDLHVVGRILTRTDILRVLVNRLQITDELARHPEILERPVDAPIFVTGTGRSGTSLLHDLLGRDPAHRAPRTWEMRYPIGRAPGPIGVDARRAAADRDVTLWNLVTPEYASMHTNGGDQPNECTFMVMHEFLGSYWMGAHDAPDYARWLYRADPAPAFRFHRRFLQLLTDPSSPRRWVLKDPWHLSTLPALFAEYPDARVVITHRDPLEVLPSLADLMSCLRWQRSGSVDREQVVQMTTVGTALQLDAMTKLRDDGVVPSDRIVDVRYRDLVADPVATIAATYRHLDIELNPRARDRVVAAVAAPRTEPAPHEYAFEDLGVDRAEVEERFAGYRVALRRVGDRTSGVAPVHRGPPPGERLPTGGGVDDRMGGGKQVAHPTERDDFAGRNRPRAGPDGAVDEETLGSPLHVDPVRRTRVARRDDEPHPAVVVDVDLAGVEAGLSVGERTGVEPVPGVDRPPPVVGVGNVGRDHERLVVGEIPPPGAVGDARRAPRWSRRRDEPVVREVASRPVDVTHPVLERPRRPLRGAIERGGDVVGCGRRRDEPAGVDPLDVEVGDRVVVPVELELADQQVPGGRIGRDPVAGTGIRGDPELERAVGRHLEVVEGSFAEHAELPEVHVAVDEREDRLAHSGDISPDPVRRTRVDRGAQVDVVGIRATPLRPRFLVPVEARMHRVGVFQLTLEREHGLACEVPVSLRPSGRILREPVVGEGLTQFGKAPAPRSPRCRHVARLHAAPEFVAFRFPYDQNVTNSAEGTGARPAVLVGQASRAAIHATKSSTSPDPTSVMKVSAHSSIWRSVKPSARSRPRASFPSMRAPSIALVESGTSSGTFASRGRSGVTESSMGPV